MTEPLTEKPAYLVTSALPYVNGVKHIGNVVGSMLPADVYARFLRLTGARVLFVCGTDDHGTTSEIAALQEGMPVTEYCAKYYAIQKEVYAGWNLSFDVFSRTSNEENHRTTQELFKKVYENGYIQESVLRIPYCLTCPRYLADRFIEGTCPHCGFEGARGDQCEKCGKVLDANELIRPHCNICKQSRIEFRSSKHLFFQLQKLSPKLREWLSSQAHWPANARNFALQWIESGLKPRCITRDLQWGVKVPLAGYEDKVFYVWFDAPIGYISFTKEWANARGWPQVWEQYWRNENARIVHFLGKDNIAFHAVIWPAMLLASGYARLPYRVQSYEFLNLEGKKFSTSRNWGIDAREALEWFPADYWRYYLLSILPEHSDANFSWSDFRTAVNSDLADVYGNLVHRCLTFTHSHYGGHVPTPAAEKDWSQADKAFAAQFPAYEKKVRDLLHAFKIQEALRTAMEFGRLANKYFSEGEPWKKIKGTGEDTLRAATCIHLTLNASRSLSVLLSPFIPASTQTCLHYLNAGKLEHTQWEHAGKLLLPSGHPLAPADTIFPLFKKLEQKDVEKYSHLVSSRSNITPPPAHASK